MDLGQLKTQILTMTMMKSGSSNGNGDIMMILYSMVLLNIIEWVFKQVPTIILFGKEFIATQFNKRAEQWKPLLINTNSPQKINSITLVRTFVKDERATGRNDNNPIVERVDAVLDYICLLDNACHIRMDIRTSLNCSDDIDLTPLLKAKIKQQTSSQDAGASVELVLYSSIWKISDIRTWIDDVYANYVAEKNNKLGNRIYYFNEVVTEPQMGLDMSKPHPSGPSGGEQKPHIKWDQLPKMLTFGMNEFKTSKSFTNIYGNHVDDLRERLDLFMNHPEWYMDRGIPHTLGVLMYGVPGAGKTSSIKALIKDTHRHPFNLKLRKYTTQTQLTNLFFNETVFVQLHDGTKQTLRIPLNKRLYIIEDIDCLSDVALDRKNDPSQNNKQDEGDALTKSFLLNLIDGVLETPGRILVITTNYPDRLDSALIRPGRIDVRIEFGYVGKDYMTDMFKRFFSITDNVFSVNDIPESIVDIFTPAEIMESMCNNYKSWSKTLERLVVKSQVLKEKIRSHATLLDDVYSRGSSVGETESVGRCAIADDVPGVIDSQPAIDVVGISQHDLTIHPAIVVGISQHDLTSQPTIVTKEVPAPPLLGSSVSDVFQKQRLLVNDEQKKGLINVYEAQKKRAEIFKQEHEQRHKNVEQLEQRLQQTGMLDSLTDQFCSASFENDVPPAGAGGWIPGRD